MRNQKNNRSPKRKPITIGQFERDKIQEAAHIFKKPSPYIQILKNRNFLFLWLGQAISNTGDWLIVFPLLFFVKRISGSATAVGALMIFKILPALLFSPIVGVLADRLNRKRVMVFCDVMRSFLVVLLAFAQSLYQIYAIVFVIDTMSLLFLPSKDASIPNIVERDHIITANSLSFTTNQVTMILGLIIGSSLMLVAEKIANLLRLEQIFSNLPVVSLFVPKLFGQQAVFLFDGFSFLLSASTIALIHLPPSKHVLSKMKVTQLKEDIIEGLKFLRDHQQVRAMLSSIGLAILGAGAIYTVGAFYSEEVLKVGDAGAIPLLIGFAIGILIGALTVDYVSRFISKDKLFVNSILAFGISLVMFASLPYFWLAIGLAAFAGIALGSVSVIGYTVLQETVSDKMRGRVFTALESILRVSLFISLLATGIIADSIGQKEITLAGYAIALNGSQITLFLGGVIMVVTGLFGYRSISGGRITSEKA